MGKPVTREGIADMGALSLTATMERGAVNEAPRAVWLARVAAVMEARGDRDEAVRLYGEASAALTGTVDHHGGRECLTGVAQTYHQEVGVVALGKTDFGDNVVGGGAAGVMGRSAPGESNLFPYSARAHFLASMLERAYRRHFQRWSCSVVV